MSVPGSPTASRDGAGDEGVPGNLFRPGHNCWRLEPSTRLAVIIDGENYFRAAREAILAAKSTVFILGWDIHSQLRLVRHRRGDGNPQRLGKLLDHVASKRGVDVYVLSWDFAMIYWLERETLPQYRLDWQTHSRVHFQLDSHHPLGASQHQKVIVVDDVIAFSGGFDLSKWRWDTREHRPRDKRRMDPDGQPYPPFHDVQMAVEGPVAAALGELCRERWERATGDTPRASSRPTADSLWPSSLQPLLRDRDIAIARSMPPYEGTDAVREVEQLYLDMIGTAQRWIYIENQYLSAHSLGEALAARLRENNGPEVVIVLPRETGGWLEQHTMDVLRSRLLRRLREADLHNRLRVFFPQLDAGADVNLMVHAKLMVIDDSLLRIGSANLSNRSMGLDSECDLVVEARSAAHREAIISVCNDLLAEHLDTTPQAVANAVGRRRSLIGAIEELAHGERRLVPLDATVSSEIDQLVPDAALIDPEQPVTPEAFARQFVPLEPEEGLPWRVIGSVLLLLLFAALAAAWRWTGLGEWLDVQALVNQARSLNAHPVTPLLATLGITAAATLAVPITLLIIISVLAFGPVAGFAYALVGGELSAILTYGAGAVAGKDLIQRYAGSRLKRVSEALARRGVLTIVTVRVVPVAPFVIINLVAGASRISFRDFALGTLLGMAPGMAVIALFAEGLLSALRQPDTIGLAGLLLLALGLLTLGLLALRRRTQGTRR